MAGYGLMVWRNRSRNMLPRKQTVRVCDPVQQYYPVQMCENGMSKSSQSFFMYG